MFPSLEIGQVMGIFKKIIKRFVIFLEDLFKQNLLEGKNAESNKIFCKVRLSSFIPTNIASSYVISWMREQPINK